ncbi:type IV secretory system conjugative DNA transfer family protein, partial [Acinetobacter baumannii]
ERPLLSPDEVGNFSKEHAVAKLSGQPPVKFKRIIYYEDKLFKARLLPPITIPAIGPIFATIQVKMPVPPDEKNIANQKEIKPKVENLSEIEEV